MTLDLSAGALGTSHVVMVNHVHNTIANLGANSPKLREHMHWLVDKIKRYNVQVIMGDYNMALFHAVALFRSCGIVVNVGAWFPWKDLDGQPMSDSCGIFFVNLPGEYKLHHGLSCLHTADDTGLFYNSGPAVAGRLDGQAYDRIDKNTGPGKPLSTYVPKGKDTDVANWDAKIRPFLTPCAKSADLVEQYGKIKLEKKQYKRSDVEPNFLRMKEKRLELTHWLVEGRNVGGSHFPLCVFTNNLGRRTPEKISERRRAAAARKEAARRSCGAHEPLSGIETTSNQQEQPGRANGSGWWSSSWVSNDGTTSHEWHCWWTNAGSGAVSSSSWQDRSWQ